MRNFLTSLLLLTSFSTWANNHYKVQITSFRPTGQNTYSAEICGLISGASLPPQLNIRVLSDPHTDRAGVYNTFVDQTGRFCLALATYTGYAHVSIWGQPVKATEAQITFGQMNRDLR